MSPTHVFLSVFVAALWGLNYVMVPIGLETIPPLLLSFVRLFLVSVSAIFFVKRPKIPLKMILFYGLAMFTMQFGFLFSGMYAGVSPTLAPLLLQTQVFFTAVLAFVFLKEKLNKWQVIGALVAFSGIALVGIHSGGSATLLGLVLVLAAGASWGMGNIVSKKIGNVDLVALVIWGSLIAWPPLLLISLFLEGVQGIEQVFAHLNLLSIISILYLTYGSLFLGFWIWSRLIYLYPLATIAPFTLLVPVFGSLGSSLIFSIPLHLTQIIASFLVIGGLCIDMFGSRKKPAQ